MNRLAPVVAPFFVLLASTACAETASWIFKPSNFSHDPTTGARVAQYVRKPPVEPLPDPRAVTSRYRRTRTNLRGTDGSLDTIYEVQAWGNGQGGIDAEWERFHNAWQDSYLTGRQSSGNYRGYGYPGYGYPRAVPYGGYGNPGPGAPPIYRPGTPDYGYNRPHHGPPHYDGHHHNGHGHDRPGHNDHGSGHNGDKDDG